MKLNKWIVWHMHTHTGTGNKYNDLKWTMCTHFTNKRARKKNSGIHYLALVAYDLKMRNLKIDSSYVRFGQHIFLFNVWGYGYRIFFIFTELDSGVFTCYLGYSWTSIFLNALATYW